MNGPLPPEVNLLVSKHMAATGMDGYAALADKLHDGRKLIEAVAPIVQTIIEALRPVVAAAVSALEPLWEAAREVHAQERAEALWEAEGGRYVDPMPLCLNCETEMIPFGLHAYMCEWCGLISGTGPIPAFFEEKSNG